MPAGAGLLVGSHFLDRLKDRDKTKDSYTLHDFRLSQTKDQRGERIVGISLVFGQYRLSYILKYGRFGDSHHSGLATRDWLIHISDSVRNPTTVCC